MPHATAPGRHPDVIGTSSSSGPNVTNESAHSPTRCTPVNTTVSVARYRWRSRTHGAFGDTPQEPTRLGEPEARARGQQRSRPRARWIGRRTTTSRASCRRLDSRSTARPRGRATRRRRLVASRAAPRAGPATRAAFATPSANHASPANATTASTPVAAGAPVIGTTRWWSSVPARRHRRTTVSR